MASKQVVLCEGPSTLATLLNHMWPRIVAGIFIPVGNHYFQALASTLQFVAQVCDRLWLVPATVRAFAYITYMSPPHVALVWPPQCAATCGWTKWPVCSGPYITRLAETPCATHTWQGDQPSTCWTARNKSSTRKNAHIARGLQNISPLMRGSFSLLAKLRYIKYC